jgi:hypothetical protein
MSSEEEGYSLVCPYWIDTDAYTDRDRLMFVAGCEFEIVLDHVRHDGAELCRTIHRENESRIRLMCGHFRRSCEITAVEPKHDPNGSWSYLRVAPR